MTSSSFTSSQQSPSHALALPNIVIAICRSCKWQRSCHRYPHSSIFCSFPIIIKSPGAIDEYLPMIEGHHCKSTEAIVCHRAVIQAEHLRTLAVTTDASAHNAGSQSFSYCGPRRDTIPYAAVLHMTRTSYRTSDSGMFAAATLTSFLNGIFDFGIWAGVDTESTPAFQRWRSLALHTATTNKSLEDRKVRSTPTTTANVVSHH